jgi:hypothetical protein
LGALLHQYRQLIELWHVARECRGDVLAQQREVGPRRVVGRAVVGAKECLELVFLRRLRARRAGTVLQALAIPVRALVGRQDAPAHRSEPALEERRGQAQDVMLGRVPSNKALCRFQLQLAKAHERVHAMLVLAHALHAQRERAHVAVDLVLQQLRLAVCQPIQHAIQQLEAISAAVERSDLCELDKPARHAGRC